MDVKLQQQFTTFKAKTQHLGDSWVDVADGYELFNKISNKATPKDEEALQKIFASLNNKGNEETTKAEAELKVLAKEKGLPKVLQQDIDPFGLYEEGFTRSHQLPPVLARLHKDIDPFYESEFMKNHRLPKDLERILKPSVEEIFKK